MNKYDMYVTFIFLIKIGFILMAVSHIYLKSKGQEKSNLDKKVLYWKERLEFIFIAAMSVLLIYLFNPRSDKNIIIDRETKILLFLFGFILLLTAKWDIFFKESPIFARIQKSIGSA
jgi:hypothetical protein